MTPHPLPALLTRWRFVLCAWCDEPITSVEHVCDETEETMTEQQRQARKREMLAQELAENRPRILWLSFCDEEKPRGEQFLGVVITEALGLVHALRKTWDLGINPGGQVLSSEVENVPGFAEVKDRLLSKADLIKAGLIEENEE